MRRPAAATAWAVSSWMSSSDSPTRLLLGRHELGQQPRLSLLALLDVDGGGVEGVGHVGQLTESPRDGGAGGEIAGPEAPR